MGRARVEALLELLKNVAFDHEVLSGGFHRLCTIYPDLGTPFRTTIAHIGEVFAHCPDCQARMCLVHTDRVAWKRSIAMSEMMSLLAFESARVYLASRSRV